MLNISLISNRYKEFIKSWMIVISLSLKFSENFKANSTAFKSNVLTVEEIFSVGKIFNLNQNQRKERETANKKANNKQKMTPWELTSMQ